MCVYTQTDTDTEKMTESALTSKMTGVIVSVFTTTFTLSILYSISSERLLWVAIFIVFKLFVLILQRLISKCCYSRAETNDVDKTTLHRFTVILDLTVTFVLVKLVMDMFTFLMAVNTMAWYDYVNIGGVVLFFVLVIFARLEF